MENTACVHCGRATPQIVTERGRSYRICLDCNAKDDRRRQAELRETLTLLNVATRLWNSDPIGGIVPIPVMPIPSPPLIETLNMGNVNVQNSNVGVINTGTIQSIANAAGVLRTQGESEIASTMEKFAKDINDCPGVDAERKNTIGELLSMVADEATKPLPERRRQAALANLMTISALMQGFDALTRIWNTYSPSLIEWFK